MIALTDADGDGFVSALCSGEPTDDCNDTSADVRPDVPEISNGRDDDCDMLIDEVAIVPEQEIPRLSSVERILTRGAVRTALGDVTAMTLLEIPTGASSGRASFVRFAGGETSMPILQVVAGDGEDEEDDDTTDVPLTAREIVSVQRSASRAVVAVVPDGTCGRVVVGDLEVAANAPPRARVRFGEPERAHFARGLPDDAGRDCRSTDALGARAPALAVDDVHALVAWQPVSAPVSTCGAEASTPVLLRALTLEETGVDVGDDDGVTLRVGSTTDDGPAALLSHPDGGFVLAFAAGHEVSMWLVTVGERPEANALGRVTMGAPGEPVTDVRLAFGRGSTSRRSLFLLAQHGPCERRRVGLVRLAHRLAEGNLIVFDDTPIGVLPEADLDTPVDTVDLVFSDVPRGAWVAWSDASNVRIRRFPEVGNAVDAPSSPLRFASGGGFEAIASLTLLPPTQGLGARRFSLVGVGRTAHGTNAVIELSAVAP